MLLSAWLMSCICAGAGHTLSAHGFGKYLWEKLGKVFATGRGNVGQLPSEASNYEAKCSSLFSGRPSFGDYS